MGESQTCDADVACEAGLVCILPKCVAPLPDGAYCFDTTHCESGTCDTGFCGVPFWMMEDMVRNYDSDTDGDGDFSDVFKGMVVPPDIKYGFTSSVPPSHEANSFTEETPSQSNASLARWIVHSALWATISTGEGDAFRNPRSTTDGASMASSSGRPVFNVPNVDTSFQHTTTSSMAVTLSFSERGTCGSMCTEVVIYGKAVQFIENSPEFMAALASFKVTHPMAEWLWGGLHTSKYYTVVPTSILIRASPEEAEVSVSVTEYLSMVFKAGSEGGINVANPDSSASLASTISSAAWPRTTTMGVMASLVMVYHIAL